jgi:transketolase
MSKYHRPDAKYVQSLKDVANKLRINSILATNASNSGHPTSCCSAAEIMSTLFFYAMKYNSEKPRDAANDRFVLSKGHAAPILYAAWAEAGFLTEADLLNLRKVDSALEGHPTPRLPFVDVATGSLGQGLSCAAGMAYVGKYVDQASYRVYCLIGDGESAEGSIWEALHFASHNRLDNLVAVFDINRLGQSESTSLQHDLDVYQRRLEAFGWNTCVVDGHDVDALCHAFYEAATVKDRPSCILAKTFKGRGIPGVEDQDDWHGKPIGPAKSESVLAAIHEQIVNPGPHGLHPELPTDKLDEIPFGGCSLSESPAYKLGDKIATRLAYGTALAKLGKNNPRVIGLDGDTKNSTYSIKLKEANPRQFIECFIAEQNLVGVAIGLATRNRTVPFASTFACFLSRAYDQLRMGAISQSNANFCGSHSGVSIGEDGPSQMALEDLAMFRAIPGSTVFYPSDAVSTERAVELAANTAGICFIRTSRPNVPVIYGNDEQFVVGKAKIVRQSNSDQVTVIGACVTLVEALKAANELETSGIHVRVIDPFTIKPLDVDTILHSARQTSGRIVVVEDHYSEGGIGEAVSGALSTVRDVVIKRLAVTGVPRSGKPEELLEMFGINAHAIVSAVKEVLKL